jgi:hypothetical protein
MAVQFFTDVDMNNNKITELQAPVANTDAATKLYVDNAVGGISGFASSIGNGVATTFNVVHNLGTEDLIVSLREISSGDFAQATTSTNGINSLDVTFSTPPSASQFRVIVVPAN